MPECVHGRNPRVRPSFKTAYLDPAATTILRLGVRPGTAGTARFYTHLSRGEGLVAAIRKAPLVRSAMLIPS